jgi:hypothetical protein
LKIIINIIIIIDIIVGNFQITKQFHTDSGSIAEWPTADEKASLKMLSKAKAEEETHESHQADRSRRSDLKQQNSIRQTLSLNSEPSV